MLELIELIWKVEGKKNVESYFKTTVNGTENGHKLSLSWCFMKKKTVWTVDSTNFVQKNNKSVEFMGTNDTQKNGECGNWMSNISVILCEKWHNDAF